MKNFYSKTTLFFVLFSLTTNFVFSQNESTIWTKILKNEIASEKLIRKSEPTEAIFYNLDLESLKSQLENAPSRQGFTGVSNVIVSFPENNGVIKQYRIKEASILAPELQGQFPNIRSYVGVSVDLKSSIRFSVASDGLHIIYFNTDKGTQFLDPYTKDLSKYIIYAKKDLPQIEQTFKCGVEDSFIIDKNLNADDTSRFNDGNMRTFRLALACTNEYAAFHGGTTAGALAAMNTTMTRVNGVFENELSLTMQLVANNNNVIFTNAGTDPFTGNDNANVLINESQTIIDANIGNANYDIGHTFSTGGGGLAALNSPCVSGSKALGITGSSSPSGDSYDIDYVAHEMGHQYGANHTFNGDALNCAGGNRNNPTAYEPGSGSTIMAYAGICAPQNVQNNSDDYFHVVSLNEIWANINSGNSTCAATSSTGNSSPTINALTSYNIPKSTPFILKGNGDDPDGTGTLTYCWEQFDNEINPVPLLSTSTSGPTFRSVAPSNSTDRYMPALATVLMGSTESTWEVVPSVARDMDFELTVRDNDTNGGRYTTESMTVTVENVDPFVVTAPNSVVDWAIGSSHDVTWDVGSTTNGTINCQNVNIKLSTDGGLTYPITLVSNTPNDGSQSITVPNNLSTTCRIIVEAVGNIFYDISNNDFIISTSGGSTNYCPSTYTNVGSEFINNISFGTIDNASGDAATNGYEDFTAISTNVDASSSYLLEVTINTAGNFIDYCNVYIDWNQDFAFDPVTEFYDLGNITNVTAGVLSTNITVPANAINGNTRMRINIENGPNPGPCDVSHTVEWGETEDYAVTIAGGLSVKEESFEEFKLYPNPSEGTINVSLILDSTESIQIDLFDLLGRTIKTTIFENNNLTFNEQLHYNNLAKGVYLIKVKQGNKITSKQLIIK